MICIKKILLTLLTGTILFYIGNSLIKGTRSLDEYIEFKQTLKVDKTNKQINQINVNTTVSSLINSINKKNENITIEIYDSSNKIKESTAKLASGDYLKVLESNQLKSTYQLSVIGDSSGDCILDLIDLVQMRKQIVGWLDPDTNKAYKKTGVYYNALDLNNDNIVDLIDLVQMRKAIVNGNIIEFEEIYKAAELKYKVSNKNGRWIFINNPERLLQNHLTDTSNRAVYSDYMNGNAEIYFEHNIQPPEDSKHLRIDGKSYYTLRFHNPGNTNVTLKINACGTTLVRGNDNAYRYIDTWEEYYAFAKCSIAGTTYTISPGGNQYFYLSVTQTGTGWGDYESELTTTFPSMKIPESVFDGVVNATSSGLLNVETFIFEDFNTIPKTPNSGLENYRDNERNSAVVSGYYEAMPFVTGEVTFNFYDNTPTGPLKVKYDTENKAEREVWHTHNIGEYSIKNESYKNDSLIPILRNKDQENNIIKARNWGNWAVHYTENIKLVNSGNKDRTIAYYVKAYYGGLGEDGKIRASAIVAYPKDTKLSYNYKREGIGAWQDTNEFLKVWEIKVPANSTVIVPTEVLLGGNCTATIEHKIELVK